VPDVRLHAGRFYSVNYKGHKDNEVWRPDKEEQPSEEQPG